MPELPYSLGRIEAHDERSRNFPAPVAASPLHTVNYVRQAPIWNQGKVGACTGHACVGTLMTLPYWAEPLNLKQADAFTCYSYATTVDRIPGKYKPDDTGSTGLAVAKWAKDAGHVTSYHHAFGLTHMLGSLMLNPVLLGIPWYDSMFDPDSDGVIKISANAETVGGHEISVVGYDFEAKRIRIANSWGPEWGDKGYCWMGQDDLYRLLHEGGDVTVLVK